MLKSRITEIIVLFLLASMLIVLALAFNHYMFVKPNTYNIIFKDIDSIVKGSPVRFMGINSGYVAKLRRKDGYIICKIRITKKGVKIPNLTRAKVAFNGLGGSKSIELMPPVDENSDLRGIVADDALRISDLGGMVRAITEVSVFMNKFVHELDINSIHNALNSFSNKEMLTKIENDVQSAAENEEIRSKNVNEAVQKESILMRTIDYFNGILINLRQKIN
ncbi:MAG: MlaD family protein [Candidatus Gastranaerophilales bacterium]|nr:MlaD family protein [Candidatus Gastranaerophilales bacterium]